MTHEHDDAFPVDFGPGFNTSHLDVPGATIGVTVGGNGPALLVLHGYGEDSRMRKPLATKLAAKFTVIAPDLPGIGNSSIPTSGLDMKTSAQRIHDAVGGAELAGHAIAAGLVDELHLIVVPTVVGGGRAAFAVKTRLNLELLDDRRFGNGTVHLHYALEPHGG